jgi:hypothetical protein
MRNLCILGLIVLLSVPAGAAARTAEPVAIVYSLIGKASISAPEPRPLRLFDRLPAGTILEVGPGSRLAIAFVSGRRYELGKSRVILGPEDFASLNGAVRSLPRLPPLLLSPIAAEDRPGPRAGALRIRTERITGLYPRRGAAVLAGEAVLVFAPVEKGGRYRVEVQDNQGQVVFRADAEAPSVRVPRKVLLPGTVYSWMVRTLDRPGPLARGEANFVTVPDHVARMREELRIALAAEGNGESLALLAEIDRSLGMLLEAREELRAVLAKSPENIALAEELATVEQQLEVD